MKYSYIFYTRSDLLDDFSAPEISLDMFYKMKMISKLDKTAFKDARKINPDFGKTDLSALWGMEMRRRFDSAIRGPYQVNMEGELDRNEFEHYIRHLTVTGKLKSFLEKAKV